MEEDGEFFERRRDGRGLEKDWKRMEEDGGGFLERRRDGRGLEEDGGEWRRILGEEGRWKMD